MADPDSGAGNERTALAWQRTALGVVAGSAILARLTFARLGLLALVTVAIALPIGLWIFLESRARYRHDAGIHLRPRSRGGRSPFTLSLATMAIGFTELAALLV